MIQDRQPGEFRVGDLVIYAGTGQSAQVKSPYLPGVHRDVLIDIGPELVVTIPSRLKLMVACEDLFDGWDDDDDEFEKADRL